MDNYEMGYMPSKRDKKRQTISHRLNQISSMFESERDFHYREMLHGLQSTLSSLHSGTNEQFLEELQDLQENRDEELVRLKLWQQYQLECTERNYQREVELANKEHEQMIEMVKERLMNKLEAQKKKLKEDKALLDIANDHSFFLASSYNDYNITNNINNINNNINDDSGNNNNNNNTNNNNNGANSPGRLTDRRSLRRRELFNNTELSGMSGGENGKSSGGGGGGGGGGGSRRKVIANALNNTRNSDAELFSDRDVLEGVLFGKERDAPSTRHTSRSYQGVSVLKPEEAMEDLALIRTTKRKR